jgi:uncharacterized integral membrane protein (TIGR00698 family)
MPAALSADLAGRLAAARPLIPGVAFSAVLAMAAAFVAAAHGGPVILFALLFGMAFNYLAAERVLTPGLAFASRSVLRLGVALLGARITAGQIAALGPGTLAGVAACVVLTIGFGILVARAAGLGTRFGTLTAGAVAICGASAAAAIAAVLPRRPGHERDTAFTIIGVTTLSTVAMVIYPLLARALGLGDTEAGVFLGATIHDVAQVVGAGFSISPEAGKAATIVKLLRVAMLVPVVVTIAVVARRAAPAEGAEGAARPPLLPGFLVGFLAIVALNSLGLVPAPVQEALGDASRWCIVTSIAALGVKTSLKSLADVGRRAVLLMVAETAFIGAAGLALVHVS